MGTNAMSATACRLTLKFNFNQQIRACGWTESYDLGYADLPTAVAASPNIAAFIYDRCLTLGIGPLLVEAVLGGLIQPPTPGAPLPRRNTLAFPLPNFPPAGSAYNKAFVNTVGPPKQNYDADFGPTVFFITAQTNLSTSPVYRRTIWLAGLPDIADETDSPRIEDPATAEAVKKFLNDLSNGNFVSGIPSNGCKNSVSIRSVDRSTGNPVKPCTVWNLNVNNYTVPAHGFVQGQPIVAEGMKTIPGGNCPRGAYLVKYVDADTIALQGSNSPPTAALKTGGFRARTFAFNAINVVTMNGFTKRNKGRPSGLSRGARSRQLIKRV